MKVIRLSVLCPWVTERSIYLDESDTVECAVPVSAKLTWGGGVNFPQTQYSDWEIEIYFLGTRADSLDRLFWKANESFCRSNKGPFTLILYLSMTRRRAVILFHGYVSIPLRLSYEYDVTDHTLTIPGIDISHLAYIKAILIAYSNNLPGPPCTWTAWWSHAVTVCVREGVCLSKQLKPVACQWQDFSSHAWTWLHAVRTESVSA